MLSFRKSIIFMLTLTGVFSYSVFTAQAYSFFSDQAVAKDCFNCGACSLCDLLLIASKGMRFLLSLCGAIALALFIYGGFELLISQGKAEAVEHGKKMITGTVIGVFIILLVAWVWPNWVIISLKGIPTEGKPATIFSNDAWWITPCREYKEGGKDAQPEKCATPATLSPLTGTSADTCVKVNEQGVPVGFNESGTPCNECDNPPCVCSFEKRECADGCRTNIECRSKRDSSIPDAPFYNFCYKEAGEIGICELVEPGDPCEIDAEDQGCPDYRIPNSNLQIQMYCELEGASRRCHIRSGEICKEWNLDYSLWCRAPFDKCVKVTAEGISTYLEEWKCKKDTTRICTSDSECDRGEWCGKKFSGPIYTRCTASLSGCRCYPDTVFR